MPENKISTQHSLSIHHPFSAFFRLRKCYARALHCTPCCMKIRESRQTQKNNSRLFTFGSCPLTTINPPRSGELRDEASLKHSCISPELPWNKARSKINFESEFIQISLCLTSCLNWHGLIHNQVYKQIRTEAKKPILWWDLKPATPCSIARVRCT